jgi:DNA polymerase elongation subunit (family B)
MSSPATRAETDRALFGRDDTPRIIDVQPLIGGDRPAVRRFQRDPSFSKIIEKEVPFYPFFFVTDIDLLQGFERSRFQFRPLAGENDYRFLVVFERWNDHWEAYRQIKAQVDLENGRPEEVYLIPSPAQQYFMQTGQTSFKEMSFEDLHRLQLDIEVFASGSFPNAARKQDRIILVALSDNHGWEHVIDDRSMSEPDMLRALVRSVQDRDPDVIEGHNIFAFDFDYILKRCDRFGVSFSIGRDGSPPRTFSSSMRFAERTVDFPAVDIAGRHVIDTYFQVMSFDVFKRDLPGYGLKEAARYFDLASDDRTYIEGNEIADLWRSDPDLVRSYALDDVRETERLARHLSGSTFYLTQMLPMSYEQVARSGPAAKIESLFVREYLHQKHSIPSSEWGSQTTGGYTAVLLTGVVGPIVYADVESLYPSIMLNYEIQPEGDTLNLFPAFLEKLTDMRLEVKRRMSHAEDAEVESELDARQNSYKILINSFYGMLGFGLAAFNDVSEADRVARTGQQILRQIIDLIHEDGGQVVEADTDGVLFIPPDGVRGPQQERAYLDSLNEQMPEGIRIGFDGRYQRMLSYKKKNYALRSYDGSLTFKGSSLISRSNEAFGRKFVREAVTLLLEEDITGLHELYLDTRRKITEHDWTVDDFARTETLKDTIEQYRRDVDSGKRPRAAAYELAIERAARTQQEIRKGDRITYYITGDDANVTAFKNARLADEWDPEQPDENTAYYLKRFDQFTGKFKPFFEDHDFRLVFSPEDLFGFTADGIELQTTYLAPDESDEDVPF